MLAIICCLSGIFIGLTTSWYFQIKPMSQLKSENSDLRQELEATRFDLSLANRKIEMKDKVVEQIAYETSRNEYNNSEAIKIKLNRINELAKIYQDIN